MPKQTSEKARLARALGNVPLFSGLDERDLMAIADSGREVSFEAGKAIIRQGERGLGFMLILDGKVEVRKKGKALAKIGAGGFFGEMTVIDDKPRSADVVAVEPTTCFGITEWSFFPILSSNPGVAIGIIKELVRRLRQLEESPES